MKQRKSECNNCKKLDVHHFRGRVEMLMTSLILKDHFYLETKAPIVKLLFHSVTY